MTLDGGTVGSRVYVCSRLFILSDLFVLIWGYVINICAALKCKILLYPVVFNHLNDMGGGFVI